MRRNGRLSRFTIIGILGLLGIVVQGCGIPVGLFLPPPPPPPSGPNPLADSPWPKFMHDLQHTGRSPFTGPATPVIKWTFDTGNPDVPVNGWVGSPVIGTDGTIYATSAFQGGGVLFAINPDGSLKCSFSGPAITNSIHVTPAIAQDGTIYVVGEASPHDLLYALDPNCPMTMKWSVELPSPTSQQPMSPTIGSDGTVYVALGAVTQGPSKFYAVNQNGTIKWSFDAPVGLMEGPAALLSTGDLVLAGGTLTTGGISLYIVDDTDGTLICSVPLPSSPRPASIAPDDTIYIGTHHPSLRAIDAPCPATEIWSFGLPGNHSTGVAAVGTDGTAYAATGGSTNQGFLFVVNPNGTQKCSFSFADEAYGAQIVDANGTIYVHVGYYVGGFGEKNLYAINPDCTEKWRIATGGGNVTPPAMGADGTIYASSSDGKVYAIGQP